MRNNRAKSQARRRRSNRKHRLNRWQRRNLKRLQNSSSPRPSVSQDEAIFQEKTCQLTASQGKLFFDYCDSKCSDACYCKIKHPACRNSVNFIYNTRTQEEEDPWRTAKDEEKQLIFQKIREFYAAEEKSSLEFLLNRKFFLDVSVGPLSKPKVLPIVERILSELPWNYHARCGMDYVDLTGEMEDEFGYNST